MYPDTSTDTNDTFSENNLPFLSVVMVTWNTRDMTTESIRTVYDVLQRNVYSFEIILVDNCSEDNTVDTVSSKYPDIKIIANNENYGFAKAVNQGVAVSLGNLILLLNTDVLFPEKGFTDLVSLFTQNPHCGIVAPALSPDDTHTRIEQSLFKRYPNGWDFIWDVLIGCRLRKKSGSALNPLNFFQRKNKITDKTEHEKPFAVSAVSGAFQLIRKKVFDTTGYFDENYYFYFEDIDFCERASKTGWQILYHPGISAIHYHNVSINRKPNKEDIFFNSFFYYLKKRNKWVALIVLKLMRKFLL